MCDAVRSDRPPVTRRVPPADCFIPLAVAVFLIVASAAIFQTDLHIYDMARFMELTLLVAVLPCFILSRQMASAAIQALGTGTGALLLTMMVVACLSAIMAARVSAAIEELTVNLALVIFGMTLYSAVARHGGRGAADTLLLCLFPLVAFSILVRFAYELTAARWLGETFQWTSPFLSFANVRFFSQIQAYSLWLMSIPLVLPILPRRIRWFFFLAAAGFWMLSVLVPSRSVWLSLALSALCALVIFPRQAVMTWLRPGVTALLVGVAGAYILMESLAAGAPGPREVMAHAGRVADRIELWTAAASLIAAHPFLGVGPANFPFFHISRFGHPHNVILQIAAEYGLPIAALLLLVGLRFFMRGVRTVRAESDRTLDSALFAAITCGLIDAMFSGNNLMPHSQIVMVSLVAWFLGRTASRSNGHSDANSVKVTGLIARASACAVWGVLLWTAFSYYQFVNSNDYVLITAGPRFWFDSRSVYYAP